MTRSLLLCCALLVVVGCEEERIITQDGQQITVDASGGVEMTIEGESGKVQFKSAEGGMKLPSSWPEDVAVYPDATVISTVTSGEGLVVATRSSDSIEDIIAHFEEQLKQEGWTIEMNMKTPGGAMLTASKEDDRAVNIVVSSDGSSTMINTIVN